MPGNGTIGGGGSFKLQSSSEDKLKKHKGSVEQHDEDVTYPFTVHLTFPDGSAKDAIISNKNDQVTFVWPYVPPPRS